MGLFRKGKTHIIVKFHMTDLVICSHSREEKTLTYSRINMVDPAETALIERSGDKTVVQNLGCCKSTKCYIFKYMQTGSHFC